MKEFNSFTCFITQCSLKQHNVPMFWFSRELKKLNTKFWYNAYAPLVCYSYNTYIKLKDTL